MKKVIIIVVAIFCMPFMAGAWGVLGHRIVGEVADHYLSAKARKGIQQLLGNESIAMAANWADFIKSDTSYNYLNNWHYVNLKSDLSRNEVFNFLDQQTGPNVYNRIDAMVAMLKDKRSTSEQKKFALRVLLHLVGDLHQPMHTARFEDLGGNRISLTWFGERSNLHRVW
ncbi:MAG: S1/P1 nuclease, partial [Bacteroidia bacterium]